MRRVDLTASLFKVQMQIYGFTNLMVFSVAYVAVEPSFPYHLNTFDNVAVNYSSPLVHPATLRPTSQLSPPQCAPTLKP